MYGIIATWRMVLEGITKADEVLKNHGDAGYAIVEAVKAVEDFPYYKSVGYKFVAKNPHACVWDESHISLDIYLEK